MHRKIAAMGAAVALLTGLTVLGGNAGAASGKMAFNNAKASEKLGGGEPSIAVGPEGNLYASFPGDCGMCFYSSTNNGKTWTKGGVAQNGSGDTSVNVD